MAQGLFVDGGEVRILTKLKPYFESLHIYLYTNDHEIECDDIIDNVTLSTTDYEIGSWGTPISVGGRAKLVLDILYLEYTSDATETVRGLAGVDENTEPSTLVFENEFSSPIALTTGQILRVTQADLYLWDPTCPPGCPPFE